MHTASFAELIAAAQQDISRADFAALRAAYTRLPGYQPNAPAPDLTALRAAIQERDWQTAALRCAALIGVDPLNMEAHQMMAHICRELAEPEQAQWHFYFAAGLLRAVLDSGDGRSFATAYVVIRLAEEYDVMRLLRVRPRRQQLIVFQGRPYDVWDCAYPAEGGGEVSGTIYFDVSTLLSVPA